MGSKGGPQSGFRPASRQTSHLPSVSGRASAVRCRGTVGDTGNVDPMEGWGRNIAFEKNELELGTGDAGMLMRRAETPWGGLSACIDAYEAGIRAATDLQLTIASTLEVEPARSMAAMCADLMRDVGATQVASARWILDA